MTVVQLLCDEKIDPSYCNIYFTSQDVEDISWFVIWAFSLLLIAITSRSCSYSTGQRSTVNGQRTSLGLCFVQQGLWITLI